MIGNNVRIYDSNHGMDSHKSYRIQKLQIQNVIIENGVWIGGNVVILPGVVIGEKAIIGAGSIVSKSIASYTIAVGAPACTKKIYDFEKSAWIRRENMFARGRVTA